MPSETSSFIILTSVIKIKSIIHNITEKNNKR